MTKTENYQLPQWGADDPVRREDFNNALLTLDGGMGKLERLRLLAHDMGRDQYRLAVQQRLLHGTCGLTDAMWVNSLAAREDAGDDGYGWDGRYGVTLIGTPPTVEGIQAMAAQEAYISTIPSAAYQSRRAAVTFTSDGYGTLTSVTVWSAMNTKYPCEEFSFTLTLTRTDTGEQVGQSQPLLSESTDVGRLFTVRQTDFPLEPTVPYRLEFALPEGQTFYGMSGFALASSMEVPATVPSLIELGARSTEKTITRTVTPPDYAVSAVGLVRWQGDGAVTLALNDTDLTEVQTREAVNADGAVCQETEFRADCLPEGECSVTLQMDPGNGVLNIYDYGLLWQ